MGPERMALRQEVEALRQSLDDLNRVMARQVEVKVAAEVAEVTVPRAELQRRLRRSGLRVGVAVALVLAVAGIGIGLNRATLQQAQRQSADDIRTLVQTCRTSAPTMSAADLRYCSSRVPGFAQARAQARATAETAARNERRLARLEAEVAKLEGRP